MSSKGTQLRSGGPIGKGSSFGGTQASSSAGLAKTTARETPDHNSSNNVQTKHLTSHGSFGALGGKGHGGAG